MKRFPALLFLLFAGIALMGADGCSSDPNVEGAKLDLRNQDYPRALENVEKALQNNPDNAEAHFLKGEILLAQSDAMDRDDIDGYNAKVSEMTTAFTRAGQLDPSRTQEAEQRLRLAYYNAFTRGTQAFARAKDDQTEFLTAAEYFGIANTIQPDSAGALVNQAFAFINGGEQDRAIDPLERAIEQGENTVESYTFLAQLYQANARADEAVTLLEEANTAHPGDPDVQSQLLSAYQQAGQTDRAMDLYGSAVQSDPENKFYRYNYGTLLLQSKRYSDALTQFKEAVRIDPDYANAQYNLGAVYINQAVDVNEQITAADDALRAERSDLTSAQIDQREEQLSGLVEERRMLFESAIAPLERARELTEMAGDDISGICSALLQAYAQTNQMEKAAAAQECAR